MGIETIILVIGGIIVIGLVVAFAKMKAKAAGNDTSPKSTPRSPP